MGKSNIEHKINELVKEIEDLAYIKEGLQRQLGDINVRMHQITGAIKALKELNNEE